MPTLNIQNGSVVPVAGGGPGPGDPLSLVGFLLDQGCHRLALVDVDAARGQGNNRELIPGLMQRFHAGRPKVCIQVGGGIRSSDQAQFFLDNGATWLTWAPSCSAPRSWWSSSWRGSASTSPPRWTPGAARSWPRAGAAPAARGPRPAGARIAEYGFKRLLFMDIPGPASRSGFRLGQDPRPVPAWPIYMGGSIRTLEHLAHARETPGVQGVALDALLLCSDPALGSRLHLPGC